MPGSLILILLALRGALISYGYALKSPVLTAVTGLSAALIPALMVAVLPISAGGFVAVNAAGAAILNLATLFMSPGTYAYVVFGLTAGLFISATFLADYSRTAENEEAYLAFRRQALWAGPVAIAAGVAALFIVPSPAWLESRLAGEWPWFVGSLAAFLGAISAFNWRNQPSPGRPRWAVLLTVVQFGLAIMGYGAAHAQYLLFPQVPTAEAFTGSAMFSALLLAVIVGVVVLVPAFIWLWRLFVIDPRYTHS